MAACSLLDADAQPQATGQGREDVVPPLAEREQARPASRAVGRRPAVDRVGRRLAPLLGRLGLLDTPEPLDHDLLVEGGAVEADAVEDLHEDVVEGDQISPVVLQDVGDQLTGHRSVVEVRAHHLLVGEPVGIREMLEIGPGPAERGRAPYRDVAVSGDAPGNQESGGEEGGDSGDRHLTGHLANTRSDALRHVIHAADEIRSPCQRNREFRWTA